MLKNQTFTDVKLLLKIVFFIYILVLLWLVLFKTSLDFNSALAVQIRNLELIPFTGRLGEVIENFVVFIPFGIFLNATFKKVALWQNLSIIFISSLATETVQYVLAIGVSDITDVITNTLGGLFGLMLYALAKNHVDSEKLDRFIIVFIALLIILFLTLRFFVFRVKY